MRYHETAEGRAPGISTRLATAILQVNALLECASAKNLALGLFAERVLSARVCERRESFKGKGVAMETLAAGNPIVGGRVEFQDRDVEKRVRTFLDSRHFPAFRRLHVDVENGSVRLSGVVATFYEKQVALNSCQRVAGVLHLIDEVGVAHKPKG